MKILQEMFKEPNNLIDQVIGSLISYTGIDTNQSPIAIADKLHKDGYAIIRTEDAIILTKHCKPVMGYNIKTSYNTHKDGTFSAKIEYILFIV